MFYNFKLLTIAALTNLKDCLKWMQSEGLVLAAPPCQSCKGTMSVYIKGNACIQYRCKRDRHDICINAMANSFFGCSKSTYTNKVILIYYFSQNITSYQLLIHECSDDGLITSRQTIAHWLAQCREACLIWMYKECDRDQMLGGENVLVEVDVCRVGQCYYTTEMLTEGMLVLGLIEQDQSSSRLGRYRLDVCPDKDLDAEHIITLAGKHCLPGTRIISALEGECWQCTVNGNPTSIMPLRKKYIVKSSWIATKSSFNHSGKDMAPYLAEYLYRREVKLSGDDSFAHFLRVIQAPFPAA